MSKSQSISTTVTTNSAPCPIQTYDEKKANQTPERLKVLMLIVNRQKAEFFADFLQSCDVNLQMVAPARGTAGKTTLQLLGLEDSEKTVIVAVIREKQAPELLEKLDEKFRTIKNGKGVAFTIPLSGIIGLTSYRFLCHQTDKEKY
jgi:nitrogen regulatory protein PII